MGNAGPSNARKLSLVLALGIITSLAYPAYLSMAHAQDDDDAAAGAEQQGAPAAAPNPSGAAKQQSEPEPVIWWFIKTSGAIGGFILLLSIYFVATVTRLFLEMRQPVAAPPELVNDLNERLQRREFKEIYAKVKEDDSFYSRLLATGISELPNGLAEARDSMERVGESVTVEMEKKISMLAVLGTLGPMIGLLGTLKGMIGAFSVIARSDVTIKTSEVAGSISEALLLTFEGVSLSVPAIYFFAVFRNRVSTISVTTLVGADEYLRHFAHAARSKTAPAQAAPVKPAKP